MPLAAARTLAWSLWLGGWLVIGGFGHAHLPLLAGGLLPLALWLLGIGALLALQRPVSAPVLRAALALGALGAAGGLLTAHTLPLAAGWALLVVAASRTVRQLRRVPASLGPGHPGKAGTPLAPACAGALLAWAVAGDPAGVPVTTAALALPAAAAALAVLLPRGGPALGGCRAGLFDCALPMAALAPWRTPRHWPGPAALLAMLPMMAALPSLADWCSAGGWPPRVATAAHLAAMLLPPLLLQAVLRRLPAAVLQQAVAVLLAAGGAALLWLAPLPGLMAAALLHGLAWGLAWGGPLVAPAAVAPVGAGARRAHGIAPLQAATAVAMLLLLLGVALAHGGPAALAAAHGLLALCGGIGLLAAALHNRAHGLVRHRHP